MSTNVGRLSLATFLVICGFVSAQQTNPPIKPSSPGAAIEAAAKRAAEDRRSGKPQSEERQGPIQILSDTQGVDFSSYLRDVYAKVRSSWYAVIPQDSNSKSGQLVIDFSISQNGSLGAMSIASTSQDTSLDRAAWGGIINAAPFSALPPEFKGDHVRLRFRFLYNPNAADLAGLKDSRGLGYATTRAELIQDTADANVPRYPEQARKHKIDGVVRLEATVGTTGEVKNVKILEGNSELAEESARALRHWRFRPATINLAPAEDIVRIKVEFRLDGEKVRAVVVWPENSPDAGTSP
jgi:TonB family protein